MNFSQLVCSEDLSFYTKSFHFLSNSSFTCSSITQTLPIRFSFQMWPLGMLALYTILHTGSPNWTENAVELVTGNIVLILQLLGHIFLLMVPMIEKYNWLFTTFTALVPLSWNNIQMNYCRQCKNKSDLLLIWWSATLKPLSNTVHFQQEVKESKFICKFFTMTSQFHITNKQNWC